MKEYKTKRFTYSVDILHLFVSKIDTFQCIDAGTACLEY